jgi:hypothetical protein
MIHAGADDSYWVVFPIPEVYYDWFQLFGKFVSMGHNVLSRPWEQNDRPPEAFIRFETFTDALEFELKHL